MKNLIKIITFLLIAFISIYQESFAATAEMKRPDIKSTNVTYTMIQTPTLIVANPYSYLNKNVQFPARFNKFSTLGLDYRPAMRESQIYIGVLIERDDVGNNVIPLPELKMFLKRTDAEKLTDLETGDSILIKGKVFSAALGDPWMDITELKVLTKKENKKTEK